MYKRQPAGLHTPDSSPTCSPERDTVSTPGILEDSANPATALPTPEMSPMEQVISVQTTKIALINCNNVRTKSVNFCKGIIIQLQIHTKIRLSCIALMTEDNHL